MNRMRKWLIGIGAAGVVFIGLGVVYRDPLLFAVINLLITPSHSFDQAAPPIEPDYSRLDHWAALPGRQDWADRVPVGNFIDSQEKASVDVFFLHPTTYVSAESWNQSLNDNSTNLRTDQFVMQGQASVFNGCCRVYAPRYRQATLYSFFDVSGSGEQALALAYRDVREAFRYYLTYFNKGRPFVVAGHSQGSHHLDKLLAEEIAGTPLANQMVAAYPIGYEINGDNGIPVCEHPTQTGCQITWNSVGPHVGEFLGSSDNVCVNPLTWRNDSIPATHDANIGSVNFEAGGEPEPGVADAECRSGRLWISEIRSRHYLLMPLGRDNYHIYDYALFYLSIRENVQRRVEAFMHGTRSRELVEETSIDSGVLQ